MPIDKTRQSPRETYAYLRDVPQIPDELVAYFRRDRTPPDDVAESGQQRIREACAALQRKRRELVIVYQEPESEDDE